MTESVYTDSNPIQVLSVWSKDATIIRTREMQLRSVEEENRQGPDQVRPLRLVTVYRLVVAEASPFLAIKVKITGVCYQTARSVSCHSTYANFDVLTKDIRRPEKNHQENSVKWEIHDLPTTQAENP